MKRTSNIQLRTLNIECVQALGYEWKLQKPKPKFQRSSKFQAPIWRYRGAVWGLQLGISLELGVWDLGFGPLTTDHQQRTNLQSTTDHRPLTTNKIYDQTAKP
ncbi:MAG: hypothetical protein AUI36_32200 [Cyanobacteria bacterium 13_1_40CM_2_61_4]|nr:MAG: hypothetical protein AUI36_32200 [Cyanobacteria bacterium 13_1_40CM_2_61_4]